MKINEGMNYCILCNKVDKEFLSKFSNMRIIGSNLSFQELVEKLELFPSKQVVFNETFYGLRKEEVKKILDLLKIQSINFIYITSNVEYAIYSDYIKVYEDDNIIIEGPMKSILTEEKTLKRIGYGLPFVVDLSTQLTYYDIFNEAYYDVDSLMEDLWN